LVTLFAENPYAPTAEFPIPTDESKEALVAEPPPLIEEAETALEFPDFPPTPAPPETEYPVVIVAVPEA
jgi:hypothetical protein